MDANTIRATIDRLVVEYTNPKQRKVVKVIPASSLWLALGIGTTTWRELDEVLAKVSQGSLGQDFKPEWLKEHADEIATGLAKT